MASITCTPSVRTFKPEPDAARMTAAQQAMSRPGWEIAGKESAAVRETIETYQVRDAVSALDRRSLVESFGKLAALPSDMPLDHRQPGPRRAMAAGRADAQKSSADFLAIHKMFADHMRKWANQKGENCPPEMAKRHGEAFGWSDGPWRSWAELENARFAPGRRAKRDCHSSIRKRKQSAKCF